MGNDEVELVRHSYLLLTHRFSNLTHPKKNYLFLTFPSIYIWRYIFPWVRLERPYLSICSCKTSGTLFKTSQHSLYSTSQKEFCKFLFHLYLYHPTPLSLTWILPPSWSAKNCYYLYFSYKSYCKNIKFDHVNLLLKLFYYLPLYLEKI